MTDSASPSSTPTPASVYAAAMAGLGEDSLRCYGGTWRRFGRSIGAKTAQAAFARLVVMSEEGAHAAVVKWLDGLTASRKPGTIHLALSALRCPLRLAKRLKLIRWVLDIPHAPRGSPPAAEGTSPAEVRAIIKQIEDRGSDPKGLRDLAIVRLIRDVALQPKNLRTLTMVDVNFSRRTVKVLRNGNAGAIEVEVGLPAPTFKALDGWRVARAGIVDDPTGPLFVSLSRNCAPASLSYEAIRRLIRKYAGPPRRGRPRATARAIRHGAMRTACDISTNDADATKGFGRVGLPHVGRYLRPLCTAKHVASLVAAAE